MGAPTAIRLRDGRTLDELRQLVEALEIDVENLGSYDTGADRLGLRAAYRDLITRMERGSQQLLVGVPPGQFFTDRYRLIAEASIPPPQFWREAYEDGKAWLVWFRDLIDALDQDHHQSPATRAGERSRASAQGEPTSFTTTGHAFISYVREDDDGADLVERILRAAKVPVWRDTSDLWPGEDWRLKIREAITRSALAFVACFSDRSVARTTSYQNEELLLAIDQFRLRSPVRPWLIPVRLSDCELPPFDLGAGRTLDSLQRVDLFGSNREAGAASLAAGVLRILAAGE